MDRHAPLDPIRAALPQLLTGSRLVLGAAALVAALDGNLQLSATLITVGAVTDGLDGPVARRLGAASPFGALFDYFCDYVCYVVAPWALTRALLAPAPEWLLMLPLLTGAVRYARNGALVSASSREVRELPGLGTVFFAFVSVTAVFFDARAWLGAERLTTLVLAMVTGFSLLMVVPVRYPKLTKLKGLSPIVIVLLGAMPFLATRSLAAATFVLGLLYVVVAPFFARQHWRPTAAHVPDAGRDRIGG